MTTTETSSTVRRSGIPAWILTLTQVALLATAIVVTFRGTNNTNQWSLAAIAAIAAGWAIFRPDSPATALWLVTIAAWWLTGLNTPSATATIQAALLIGAAHYLTAIRANLRRDTRISPTLLGVLLAALAGLSIATLIADTTIRLVAGSPITSDTWTLAWSAASVIVLATLAAFFTRADTT